MDSCGKNNIEPTYDLEILYNTWHYSNEFLEMMEANDEDASTIISKIDKFKEIKKLADNNDKEGLLAEYIKAEQEQTRVARCYMQALWKKARSRMILPGWEILALNLMAPHITSGVMCKASIPLVLHLGYPIWRMESL